MQPDERVVLARETRLGVRGHHRRERRDYRQLVHGVKVEPFDAAEIVEALRHESRFLAQLPQRGLDRRFSRLDRAVHRLPRSGIAAARRASQHEHFELLARATEYEGIDEADLDRRHAGRRRPSTASSRADRARARNGFWRKSSAPSSNTRTSLSSSPFAVNTITGIDAVAGRERSCDSTPYPSSAGRLRSRTIMSGPTRST